MPSLGAILLAAILGLLPMFLLVGLHPRILREPPPAGWTAPAWWRRLRELGRLVLAIGLLIVGVLEWWDFAIEGLALRAEAVLSSPRRLLALLRSGVVTLACAWVALDLLIAAEAETATPKGPRDA